jgi:DNA topoisomerase IA
MTTILAREYVEKLEGRFHPTDLGKTVNDLLIEGVLTISLTKLTRREWRKS